MTGMAAIAFCAAFTSCSKGEDIYDPDFKQKEVTLSYEQAFINTFGQPAADQDWGFGTTSARTRGDSDCGECFKFDMQYDTPSFPKTGHPADITPSERAYVKWWFENNPGLTEEGLDIHNFYLQHVWGEANKEYNVDYDRGDYIDKATMDYCEVGDGTNYTHILDFNSNSGGNWGIVYMRNSSALSFGFHATWGDNRNYHNFKLAHIVGTAEDGTKIDGWYVGLAMYGQKDDNGIRTLNKDQMTYADDWILKIVPGEGEVIPSTIRVIGEDLSANTPSDFDFNDIVVDVTLTSTGADCVLKAAGGTLPLIIGIDEPDDTKDAADYPNNEVHKLFGVTVDTMVNTDAENTPDPKDPTKMLKGASRPDVSFSITGNWSTVKDVPIYVKKNGHWMELTAERGVPASKIGVDDTFGWCDEKVNISGQYPRFTNWVTKNLDNQSKWY